MDTVANTQSSGWEHFHHMADIGVRGWGASRAEAFAQAALAMTAVVTDLDDVRPDQSVSIHIETDDEQILFLDWLNAIVYEMATRKMLFGKFDVAINANKLDATIWGEPVNIGRHQPSVEVKGATFTALDVREDNGKWLAQCVVDV